MDPKLTLLFLLIGAILGLSHLGDPRFTRLRRLAAVRRWRRIVPGWRRG